MTRNTQRTFCAKCMSTLLEGEGVIVAGVAQCVTCPAPAAYRLDIDPLEEWPEMSQDDWRDCLNPNEGCK